MTRPDDERGVVLVFVGMCLAVLMLIAALAVDYGSAASQRRKSQSTADAGVLAGGRLMLSRDGGASVSHDQIADEIIDVVWENLRSDSGFTEAEDMTRTQLAGLFAACTDPDAAGYPVASSASPCIRFSAFDSRVRLRVPTLHTYTTFARVAGFDSVAVSAFAEAELVPDGSGGIVPFGLPGSSASDTEICLKAASNGHAPNTGVCDDGQPGFENQGNFGSLDIATYGNPVLGTPEQCTGDINGRLAMNIALGVDHPMDEYRESGEGGEAVRNDRALCPDLNARPNQMLGQTGIGSNLDEGLLAGTDVDGRFFPGRLTRTPWTTLEVRDGIDIDNRPLWTYIDPTLAAPTIPAECVRSTIEALADVPARNAAMTACIDAYKVLPPGQRVELFRADDDGDGQPDLLRSPRSVFVPELHASTWATPDDLPQNYNIRAFRPVFLQTLFFKCNANSCTGVHSPGETGAPFPLASNATADALTAFLLPDDAVPQELLDNGPSSQRPRTLVLRR